MCNEISTIPETVLIPTFYEPFWLELTRFDCISFTVYVMFLIIKKFV